MAIGIDPGLEGAIAVLSQKGEYVALFDMPLLPSGKKRRVDGATLKTLLAAYAHYAPIWIEQVAAHPGQGVTSMFNFGYSAGIIEGIVNGIGGLPYDFVTPQAWKRRASLINQDKGAALTVAKRLFPEAELTLKKHVGRADALLIAKFGERT
jgi:crossover junction endodeoxyribonuclease RuvC